MSETGEGDGEGLDSVPRDVLVGGTSSLMSGPAATRGAAATITWELGAAAGVAC